MEFIGFADAKEFIKVSGISKNDLEKHVYSNKRISRILYVSFWKR
ncbi:Uncharacterised protein [Staphylococcus gallinarum]|uniref:Uncharacterized protein n=1 Tax=Staphylococcus gallinarum TaxID=1293 RepID=A0A380FFG4_STAGA|nr:Uncharacterised protein [Staphylococcus gallinarum]